MHNQFDDLCPPDGSTIGTYVPTILPAAPNYYYPCCSFNATDINSCQPFSQLGAWPGMTGSVLMLLAIYVGCYMVAWMVLIRLSSTYE